MFELQLHAVSPEESPTQIGLKTDVESLTDNVIQLTDGYNHFMKTAHEYFVDQPRSKSLVNEMSNMATTYQNALEAMVLNLTEEGTITLEK